ncbi:hypothetical protein B0H11DRAFT_1903792 [Mycena galericulata]|nr:hypothetical protein B0H11DRAFT_1903792 [Mycena galericulata]
MLAQQVNAHLAQVATGISPEKVKFSTSYPVLRNASVRGCVDLYNWMTTPDGRDLVARAWKLCVVPGKPEYNFSYENFSSRATRKALRQYLQRDSTLADAIKARVGSWELPELPDDLPESGSRAEEEDDEEGDDTDVSLAAVIHASLGEGLSAPARSRFEVERAEANDENRSRLTAGGEEEDVWSYDDEGRKWSEVGVPAAAQDEGAESDGSAND